MGSYNLLLVKKKEHLHAKSILFSPQYYLAIVLRLITRKPFEPQGINFRYSYCHSTTTIMTNIHQKHQILESIDSLDQAEAEKVLDYINVLVSAKKEEPRYQRFKREAMKEIRQALGQDRKLNPSF